MIIDAICFTGNRQYEVDSNFMETAYREANKETLVCCEQKECTGSRNCQEFGAFWNKYRRSPCCLHGQKGNNTVSYITNFRIILKLT